MKVRLLSIQHARSIHEQMIQLTTEKETSTAYILASDGAGAHGRRGNPDGEKGAKEALTPVMIQSSSAAELRAAATNEALAGPSADERGRPTQMGAEAIIRL